MPLLIARNPDPDSTLRYLIRVPLGRGLVFRTSDSWPRTKALYCHPVGLEEWPDAPELVEELPVRSCERRGAAIDLVLHRGREARSQIVYTRGRGREMVFWQSPRTRKQARPNVTLPSARAQGIPELEILVDTRERYAWRFAGRQVRTVKQALRCGDYGVLAGGQLVAAVERKSLEDLVGSVSNGRLRFALGDLAALPRAAVVVEDRWSRVFAQDRFAPSKVADSLAELQVRWPGVPIVFCETRPLAEEWAYRFLAAASTWAADEPAVLARMEVAPTTPAPPDLTGAGAGAGAAAGTRAGGAPVPPAAQLRAWARTAGIEVAAKGRVPKDVLAAWRASGEVPVSGT